MRKIRWEREQTEHARKELVEANRKEIQQAEQAQRKRRVNTRANCELQNAGSPSDDVKCVDLVDQQLAHDNDCEVRIGKSGSHTSSRSVLMLDSSKQL